MSIGGWDSSKFIGDLKWYPVVLKNYFNVKLDDIKFNGKSSGICPKNQGCLAVVDSGSSTINFPTKMIKALSDAGVPFKKNSKKCKRS
jgi:hypothetical protein